MSQPPSAADRGNAAAISEKPLVRLLNLGLKHSSFVFLLLSLLGCLGLLALPAFERRVKFDEKTLMLGSARTNIGRSSSRSNQEWCASGGCLGMSNEAILNMTQAFAQDIHAAQHQLLRGSKAAQGGAKQQHHGGHSSSDGNGFKGQPSLLDVVEHFMQQTLKLEVSRSHAGGTCTTLHGIFRAPLADGKESLVVATPAALTSGVGFGDAPPAGAPLVLSGAALLLGHLRYSPSASWIAKDVIWVVPDVGCEGSLSALERWTRTYQAEPPKRAAGAARDSRVGTAGTASDSVRKDFSFGRAGVMQQAIVLMADRVDVTQLEVLVEGHDGQLPKLDMYYMLRTAARYTTSIRVKPRAEHAQPLWLLRPVMDLVKDPKVKSHIHKVMFSLQFAARQAMGTPTGPHAAFKEFLVDAATANMSGTPPLRNDYVPEQLPRKTADYIGQVAGYLEAMLRSLNNLDERFHHSYFLYLLTSPDTFVTVEVYIVPLVALIAALMVKASGLRDALRQQDRKDASEAVPVGVRDAPQVGVQSQGAAQALPPGALQEPNQEEPPQEAAVAAAAATVQAGTHVQPLDGPRRHTNTSLWVSAIAVVLLLLAACVGLGVGLRCAVCAAHTDLQQRAGHARLPLQHHRLQQQQENAGAVQGGVGGTAVLGAFSWGQGLLGVTLPKRAGGQQLGLKEQAILIVCLLVLASTLGLDVCKLALRPSATFQHQKEGGQQQQHQQQRHQQQQEPAQQQQQQHELSGEGLEGDLGRGKARSGRADGGNGRGHQVQGVGARIKWCTSQRVVMLSCVCMMLAAMASINWALGYAVAGVLVPVVAVRGGRQLKPIAGVEKSIRATLLLLISPFSVAAALAALVVIDAREGWDGRLPLAQVADVPALMDASSKLVCHSPMVTYIMFWAALLPCWLVEFGTLLAS